MKKTLCMVACTMLLSGCLQSNIPVEALPELTFKHLAPVPVNAAKIEVLDKTAARVDGGYVDHRLPTTPKDALKNWARDRLSPYGQLGLARVIIKEAGVKEEKLTKETGLKGIFTADQSERYTATVEVVIELRDDNQNIISSVTANASRYTTMAENFSLLDREKAWLELVEKLMVDFDRVVVGKMQGRF
ncbi:hypothetical protein [Terasakiella sp. SH-1]|uniref:hypothetical protein n=1 Tax=Terasakiella sp. SH-1 TaxID=2560057 RepID=UPI0010743A04|nr:hypothetical protein [Terasakiella sp. SH-1]